MNLSVALEALEKVYTLFDRFVADIEVACRRGCAACCTRNVTLTTLEGYALLGSLDLRRRSALMERIRAAADRQRYQPALSLNALAERCLKDDALPEETNDPAWGDCPLLTNDECPVYPVRPFGCRCLLSTRDCRRSGYARIDDSIVAAAHVCLQAIEHLDADGWFGNLTDIMLALEPDTARAVCRARSLTSPPAPLVANRPLKVLMIPPQHRQRLQPLLQGLRNLFS